MANKYKNMYAIKIDGNFMNGMVYFADRETAINNLEKEVLIGYQKLKDYNRVCYPFNKVYWTTDKKILIGIDACVYEHLACSDDTEYYISYKVSRVRVPV